MRTHSLCLFALFLLLSACSTTPPRHPAPPVLVQPAPVPVRPLPACPDCGRIERVEMVSNVRATASGGAVLGGVIGGIAAGKSGASPASPARPGVQVLTFRIGVRMDDGRRLVLHQSNLASGLRNGSRVRVIAGRVLPPR